MPEGPDIAIVRDNINTCRNDSTCIFIGGENYIPKLGKIVSISTYGKILIFEFIGNTFIYMRMKFTGKILFDEPVNNPYRLTIKNSDHHIYSFTSFDIWCSVPCIESTFTPDVDGYDMLLYPDRTKLIEDVKRMNISFKRASICRFLLNQSIFPGVGNIVKNEALYKANIHPNSTVMSIPYNIFLILIEWVHYIMWTCYHNGGTSVKYGSMYLPEIYGRGIKTKTRDGRVSYISDTQVLYIS